MVSIGEKLYRGFESQPGQQSPRSFDAVYLHCLIITNDLISEAAETIEEVQSGLLRWKASSSSKLILRSAFDFPMSRRWAAQGNFNV